MSELQCLKEEKMMIIKEIQLTTNTFRYFIIILPTKYKNNSLYFFFDHESKLVTVFVEKKTF